jgi:hypothetical protein
MRTILKCEFSNANASHLKAFKGRPPYSQSDTLLKASESWSKPRHCFTWNLYKLLTALKSLFTLIIINDNTVKPL